eukprot:5291588-Pyramimonas_sp.AAC.1
MQKLPFANPPKMLTSLAQQIAIISKDGGRVQTSSSDPGPENQWFPEAPLPPPKGPGSTQSARASRFRGVADVLALAFKTNVANEPPLAPGRAAPSELAPSAQGDVHREGESGVRSHQEGA